MKKEIRYYLMNPTENRTVLVETPILAPDRPAVAAKLMELEPTAEQVGFLTASENADVALQMAGGEFCANATLSTAAIHAMHTGMTVGTVTVAVSGASEPIAVEIAAQADGLWQGIVEMPRPLAVEAVRFADGRMCPVVTFDGISHVIVEGKEPCRDAEMLAKRLCTELGADALGLMFWDQNASVLTPLVYVPRADTLFWERSCGSGTAALGAYAAARSGQTTTLFVRQPGGVLEITAASDGTLRLRGSVRCICEKTAETEY